MMLSHAFEFLGKVSCPRFRFANMPEICAKWCGGARECVVGPAVKVEFAADVQSSKLNAPRIAIMFTGIVEHSGTIESLSLHSDRGRMTIDAPTVAPTLSVSNSIAVNGCCLTVVSLKDQSFSADLSCETIRRTSFGAAACALKVGSHVNLEQPLTAGKEFGGHFVLGHVDGTGEVTKLESEGENWWYGVRVPQDFARYVVPKGSITIDGISLTVAHWHERERIAEIAVIPYTYEHTNIRDRKIGDTVNLEGDILGKYVKRYMEARKAGTPETKLSLAELKTQGF